MRRRDYLVAGLIIFGVVAVWFFLIAALMNLVPPGLAVSLAVIISFVVYLLIKRRSKHEK